MDANTTCALVTTTPFTNYNQIVDGTQRLVEFSMSSAYVSGKFGSVVSTNDFTRFITSSNSFTGSKPALVSQKQSIVTGYLGYGVATATYSSDFYTYSTTRPFRTAAQLATIVTSMISANDLCSSNDIYNPTVYSGSGSIASLSLTTLYKTLATSNLDPSIVTSIQNRIDLLQNKNYMFYSFFVYEYCYYNTMYNALLAQYFNEYSSTSPSGRFPNIGTVKTSSNTACTETSGTTPAGLAAQAGRLDGLSILLARVNSRLTDMRNLLSALQNYYSGSLQAMQTTLNTAGVLGSDNHAQMKVTALMNQSINVKQAKDDSTFRQGILEYTSEKNRYSNILLGIYAFLNIAIIGVIFAIKE